MTTLKLKHLLYACCIVLLAGLVGGCATVYTTSEFEKYKLEHQTIAIIPFDVTISPGNKSKDITAEELEELAIKQGETFQRAMYTQFLQGQQRGRYTVKFQDIDETNTLLNRELEGHANRKVLSAFTKEEICEVLEVDAIISGSMTLTKPMGTGAAIASKLLLGLAGTTNRADITISIHEGENGELLWNYDHTAKGGLLSSPEGVAKSLMRGIARSFPYGN